MDEKKKYFCIFGGGAVRGFSYIGAYKALLEKNIEISGLAGSSVGAIFSAFLAVGTTFEEFEKLFLRINFDLFKDINIGLRNNFAISKGTVFLRWLREKLEKIYYKENYKKNHNPPILFKDLDANLIIVATDLHTFKPFIFSRETTPDFEVAEAVRISCGMPGLLKPYELDDCLLSDGDLMKSIPIWKLFKCRDEHNRILEFRLEGTRTKREFTSLFDYINTVYSCMTSYSTDFVIDTYGKNDMYDFVKIDTKDFLLMDFNMSKDKKKELIQIGYDCTINFFEKELCAKEKILAEIYSSIANQVKLAKNLIESSKISEAKTAIWEIFPNLCENSSMVDFKIYSEIFRLKNIFFTNIYKGLFGKEKIKNSKLVKAHITKTLECLETKLSEFK